MKSLLDQIRELPLVYQTTITPDQEDMMGHLSAQAYLQLFDEAGWQFFKRIGVGRDYPQQTNKGIFALKHHLRFLHEVQAGDPISIYARWLSRNERRVHYMTLLMNDRTHKLATIFEELTTHIDLSVRRSAPWTPELAVKLDGEIRQHQALGWVAPICGIISVER